MRRYSQMSTAKYALNASKCREINELMEYKRIHRKVSEDMVDQQVSILENCFDMYIFIVRTKYSFKCLSSALSYVQKKNRKGISRY